MKTVFSLILVLMATSAYAKESRKLNLNVECQRTTAGKQQLDGGFFGVQCRSLDAENTYYVIQRASGSTLSRLGPEMLRAVSINNFECEFSNFEKTKKVPGGYTAIQTSEDKRLKYDYMLTVNGKKSAITAVAQNSRTDHEDLECY